MIRMLGFDEGEGYDETGYKIVSRSIMENDIGDVLMDMSFKPTDTLRSKDGEMIRNVVVTLENQMSIQIGSEIDFIIFISFISYPTHLLTNHHPIYYDQKFLYFPLQHLLLL